MEFQEFLLSHIKRRPLMEVRDVYKLLYQGVFGVGHIMSENAKVRLEEEAHRINLEDHLWEPLFEVANPEGSIVRVNLRPYMRSEGDLDCLYDIMIESSKIEGEQDKFIELWRKFKKLNIEENLGFNQNEIRLFDESIEQRNIKPHHHTEAYRQAYYPAYRVVDLEIFEDRTYIQVRL
ncbi:hypothetical protein GF319_13785 [Candidatus Bathyarchaeota archaeon]|nr:hypothetical protein [Candidatus Bathyarchaeota archaeon]